MKYGFRKLYRGDYTSDTAGLHDPEDRWLFEEPSFYGTESESSLDETFMSATHADLLSLLRASGNVEDIRMITIEEALEDQEQRPLFSELNTGFLAEFFGGDEEAMERLQMSWLRDLSTREDIPSINTMGVAEPKVPPVSLMEIDEPPLMPVAPSIEDGDPVAPDLLDSRLQEMLELLSEHQSTPPPHKRHRTKGSGKVNKSPLVPKHVIQARMRNPTWKTDARELDIIELQQGEPILDFPDPLNLFPDLIEFTNRELQVADDEALFNIEEDKSIPLSLAARAYRHEQELQRQLSPASLEALRQTLSEANMLLSHTPLPQQMPMSSSDLQAKHSESELTTAIEELTEVPLLLAEPHELEEGLQREGDTTVVPLLPTEPHELEEGGLHRACDTTVQQDQPQEQMQQEQTKQKQIQQEIQTPPPPPPPPPQQQQQLQRVSRRRNQQRYDDLDSPVVRKRRRPGRRRRRPTVHEESSAAALESLPRPSIGAASSSELPIQEVSMQMQGVNWNAQRTWTEDLLLDQLKTLWQQHNNLITFTQVCDRNRGRREAAQIFRLLLNMAKKGLLQLDQTVQFSPNHIFIRPVNGL